MNRTVQQNTSLIPSERPVISERPRVPISASQLHKITARKSPLKKSDHEPEAIRNAQPATRKASSQSLEDLLPPVQRPLVARPVSPVQESIANPAITSRRAPQETVRAPEAPAAVRSEGVTIGHLEVRVIQPPPVAKPVQPTMVQRVEPVAAKSSLSRGFVSMHGLRQS
jgi:hypothetical protein